jgi:glycosyltransferase involved in cell wall biosynthesis
MFVSTACGVPVVYAGVGPGRQLVVQHDLGWAADWDVDAVEQAMRQALASPSSASRRVRLAEWTRANASLTQVGERAADAVLARAKKR